MQSEVNQKSLFDIFQIMPDDINLFKKALTHGSYTKENNIEGAQNYERLEFLGDAVLKLCVSDILYKKFPEYSEGNLTKIRSILISDKKLAEVAKIIGLDKHIILGKHEEKMGGRLRQSILACVFEAILGAYYLEGKEKEIQKFLEKVFSRSIDDIDNNFEKFNAKAILQEYTQSLDKTTPVYNVIKEIGPSHNKIFEVEVSYGEKILAFAQGKTKKEAEQNCAYQACLELGVINK